MDDPHRRPEDADRARLVARINGAHAAGRIGATDRDIRLGNVRSAQSMVELDLMSRDLDQLEAAFPTVTPLAPAAFARLEDAPRARTAAQRRDRRASMITMGILGIVGIVLASVAVLIGFLALGTSSVESSTSAAAPSEVASEMADQPTDGSSPNGKTTTRRPAYALTVRGITGFLRTYSTWFKTSKVVDLTMYGDYAFVRVPLPRSRQEGWLWRDSTGFATFGGATARFPGTRPVDTRRLDVPALVRNLRRARTRLGVEKPTTTYVIVRGTTSPGEAVRVDIHVANEFRESAYLSTRLDGTVQRAFPFAR